MAWIISGVFFHGYAPAAGLARALHLHVLRQELLSPASHGVRIELEEVSQSMIAATAQLKRLQSGKQAALLLVQQAIEQQYGGFQFLLRDLQYRHIRCNGNCLNGASRLKLPKPNSAVRSRVKVAAGDDLPSHPLLLRQLMQRILHIDVQGARQFIGEISAL